MPRKTRLPYKFIFISSITVVASLVSVYILLSDERASDAILSEEVVIRGLSRISHDSLKGEDFLAVDRLDQLMSNGQEGLQSYAAYISRLTLSKREDDLSTFADEFFGDSDKWIEEIEGVSEILFESDRSLALTFLSYFHREQRILNKERSLLSRWLADDSSSLFQALEQNKANATSFNIKQLRQISSIYAYEMKSDFADWLSFIAGINGAANGGLQREAYTSMVEFCAADQRDALYQSLESKVDTSFQLAHLPGSMIHKEVKADVEKAVFWLGSLSNKEAKNIALQGFLSAVSVTDNIHLGIGIINSEDFMEDYFVIDEDLDLEQTSIVQQQEDFYDEALENLLEGVIESDPDFVLSAAEEFYNLEVKQDYIITALSHKRRLESQSSN